MSDAAVAQPGVSVRAMLRELDMHLHLAVQSLPFGTISDEITRGHVQAAATLADMLRRRESWT